MNTEVFQDVLIVPHNRFLFTWRQEVMSLHFILPGEKQMCHSLSSVRQWTSVLQRLRARKKNQFQPLPDKSTVGLT